MAAARGFAGSKGFGFFFITVLVEPAIEAVRLGARQGRKGIGDASFMRALREYVARGAGSARTHRSAGSRRAACSRGGSVARAARTLSGRGRASATVQAAGISLTSALHARLGIRPAASDAGQEGRIRFFHGNLELARTRRLLGLGCFRGTAFSWGRCRLCDFRCFCLGRGFRQRRLSHGGFRSLLRFGRDRLRLLRSRNCPRHFRHGSGLRRRLGLFGNHGRRFRLRGRTFQLHGRLLGCLLEYGFHGNLLARTHEFFPLQLFLGGENQRLRLGETLVVNHAHGRFDLKPRFPQCVEKQVIGNIV